MVSLVLREPFARGGSAMQAFEAVKIWLEYHKTNSREKTLRTYKTIFLQFRDEFAERNLENITSEGYPSWILPEAPRRWVHAWLLHALILKSRARRISGF
jgi:Phage integrase, N-terminal SAM-like domain